MDKTEDFRRTIEAMQQFARAFFSEQMADIAVVAVEDL